MKRLLTTYWPRFKTILRISLLWLKHLLLRRANPELIAFNCLTPIHILGNPITFFISAFGCHKIIINDHHIIPGSVRRITLQIKPNQEQITFKLIGRTGSYSKSYHINSQNVSLHTSFDSAVNLMLPNWLISKSISTTIDLHKLEFKTLQFTSLEQIQLQLTTNFGVTSPSLQFCIPMQNIILEPFSLSKYQPLNPS